jgi:glycosyltransferase involved in cell wall biosynthesis
MKILVFALLKPSQIAYKIIPLCRSSKVDKVYLIRKAPLKINSDKIECITLPWGLRVKPFYWFLTSIYGVWIIKKKNVDLIINYNIFPHGSNAYFASILSGKPFIFAEINEDTMQYYKKSFLKWFIKIIFSRAIFILVPGLKTQTFWEKAGFKKMIKLHSTIDTNYFRPDYTMPKKYDFLYIGEFDDNKRPDLIIDAFISLKKEVPDAKMCFIGYGKLQAKLENKIRLSNLSASVEIIRTDNVLTYIQQSKIFVMASKTEGLPCALFETMACELIPIVPDVGNIADVVSMRQNGILYDGSLDALIKEMKEIITTYSNLSEMRTRARETIIANHSYSEATKRWNAILLSKII